MDKNIDFYNTYAKKLFGQYQTVSFYDVHQDWFSLLSSLTAKQALDIGAGSGRDANALQELGLSVTAVEPAQRLLQLGEIYCGENVEWISDCLPLLARLKDRTFDLILLSAVWMHLTQSQQQASLSRIVSLLNYSGLLVITLRYGGFDDTRTSESIEADLTIEQAQNLGLTCIFNRHLDDKLKRNNVTWQTLVFAKQGDSV